MINLVKFLIKIVLLVLIFIIGTIFSSLHALLAPVVLWLLGLSCESVEGLEKLEKYPNGVLVYNHPTFYEFIILYRHVHSRCSLKFIAKGDFLPLLVRAPVWNSITLIKPGVSTTTQISNDMKENLVAIAPMGGACGPVQHDLAEFRTGAFVHNRPVLPVLFHYEPYEPWLEKDNLVSVLYNRLCGPTIKYKMKILDPVYVDGDPKEFANKTREIMMKELRKMDIDFQEAEPELETVLDETFPENDKNQNEDGEINEEQESESETKSDP